MTQLIYITAVLMEQDDTLLTLFISDHKQDTKDIPFDEMTGPRPQGAEGS